MKKETTSNKKTHKFLGMHYGTANSRLKKMILFNFVQELNRDICYRCNKKIRCLEEFTIDHKEAWLHVDTKLFWDVHNIAFSHLKCNSSARRMSHKILVPDGQGWCWGCKSFKELSCFAPRKVYAKNIPCKTCWTTYGNKYRNNKRK